MIADERCDLCVHPCPPCRRFSECWWRECQTKRCSLRIILDYRSTMVLTQRFPRIVAGVHTNRAARGFAFGVRFTKREFRVAFHVLQASRITIDSSAYFCMVRHLGVWGGRNGIGTIQRDGPTDGHRPADGSAVHGYGSADGAIVELWSARHDRSRPSDRLS